MLERPRAAAAGRPGAGYLGQALGDDVPQLAWPAAAVSSVPKACEAVLGSFADLNISGRRARQGRLAGLQSTRKVLS